MDARLSFVTLVVRDLARSRAFYIGGLSWPVEFESPNEVVMVRVAEKVVLSLWQEAAAVGELGPIGRAHGAPPITLAHNVATPSDVDRVLAEARAAGATVGTPLRRRSRRLPLGDRLQPRPGRLVGSLTPWGAGRGPPESACIYPAPF
jgi:hypothetical protein